jgi:hypothetical protein
MLLALNAVSGPGLLLSLVGRLDWLGGALHGA